MADDPASRLAKFADQAERLGMPVTMIRDVVGGYTVKYGDASQVTPWLNNLYLERSVLDSVETLSPAPPLGEAPAIQTIYHESTHAWLDMKQHDPVVAAIIRNGRFYYRKAPLKNGKAADDEARLLQEALASYVGHRAASWFMTLESLTFVSVELERGSKPEVIAAGVRLAQSGIGAYDKAMAERVFGYQDEGWLFNKSQVETSKPISAALKSFCDVTLLENKVPDEFARATVLKQKWDTLSSRVLRKP